MYSPFISGCYGGMINHHGTVIFLDGVWDEWGFMILASVVSEVSEGLAVPLPRQWWWLMPVVSQWSVFIQDRLSTAQPISWSPLTGRQLSSCDQPAHSLSLVCFENLLAWESAGLGEEAKHRQVLTSGEKSRCRLMTMMMVRMMHLFPCQYELQHAVWRGHLFHIFPNCNGGFLGRFGSTYLDGRAEYQKAHLSTGPQRCAMALDVQTCAVFTVIAVLVLVNVLLMFILGTR